MQKEVTVEKGLLKKVDLENGLELKIMDDSKGLIGDRWKVSVIARMDVPVDMVFKDSSGAVVISPDDVKKLLGDQVRFEKKMERHFIDQNEKDEIKHGLEVSLTESLLPYISRPEFPRLFVIKEYAKAKQKSSWQQKKR